jgi:hypothetical protein
MLWVYPGAKAITLSGAYYCNNYQKLVSKSKAGFLASAATTFESTDPFPRFWRLFSEINNFRRFSHSGLAILLNEIRFWMIRLEFWSGIRSRFKFWKTEGWRELSQFLSELVDPIVSIWRKSGMVCFLFETLANGTGLVWLFAGLNWLVAVLNWLVKDWCFCGFIDLPWLARNSSVGGVSCKK